MAPLIRMHKNDIFEWIEDRELDPATFSFHDEGEDGASRLTNHPTGHWFSASLDPSGKATVHHVPSLGGALEGQRQFNSFSEVKGLFQTWLGWVQQENEPDRWAGIPLGADAFESADDPDYNTPLTAEEVQAIEARIDNAKRLLEDSGMEMALLIAANRKLDYLAEAAGREGIGRFDWRTLALGIVVDIAVASAFDIEQATTLLRTIIGGARLRLGG